MGSRGRTPLSPLRQQGGGEGASRGALAAALQELVALSPGGARATPPRPPPSTPAATVAAKLREAESLTAVLALRQPEGAAEAAPAPARRSP